MKRNRVLFISIMSIFLFAMGVYLGKLMKEKDKNNPKTHRVGFIFPETEGVVKLDTARSHWDKKLVGVFASSYPQIYKGSKYQFRQNLLANFNANKYQDNGYFNLRFYISNEGKVWLYEVKEMDFDFNSTQFTPGLREELITLSLKKDNWNPFSEEDLNYCMHLTYRIENGKITEIIP